MQLDKVREDFFETNAALVGMAKVAEQQAETIKRLQASLIKSGELRNKQKTRFEERTKYLRTVEGERDSLFQEVRKPLRITSTRCTACTRARSRRRGADPSPAVARAASRCSEG